MPKLTNRLPSLRPHKSGQGVVTINYRDFYLGKYGTSECNTAYDRLMAEYLAANRQIVASPDAVTVAELVNAFRQFAEQRYRRPDGSPTGEAENYRFAAISLLKLFADKPAVMFGPKALKVVRQHLISRRLARTVINRSINRIKFMFKHAVEDELIPASTYEALRCVEALRRGEAGVREKPRVLPVSETVLNTVIPSLNRFVAAMAQLQLLTGMRPGEVCMIRIGDIDFASRKDKSLWLYRPANHKTKYLGHERVIPLGPAAQALLRPLLTADPRAFIFSPRRAELERRAALSVARKTPQRSGNRPGTNRRAVPKRAPGDHYTPNSYSFSIAKACERAFPLPAPLQQSAGESKLQWRMRLTEEEREEVKTWRREHHFHPHQIRHLAATKIRALHGVEATQLLLGDRSARMVDVYGEKNHAQLEILALRHG